VYLSLRELAGHGFVVGGPGSGKTTFLQLIVESAAGRMPVVIVDPKGSPALADTVRMHGGQVWTLDGKTPADLLDRRSWQVPDQLLEAKDIPLMHARAGMRHTSARCRKPGRSPCSTRRWIGPVAPGARPYRAAQSTRGVPEQRSAHW